MPSRIQTAREKGYKNQSANALGWCHGLIEQSFAERKWRRCAEGATGYLAMQLKLHTRQTYGQVSSLLRAAGYQPVSLKVDEDGPDPDRSAAHPEMMSCSADGFCEFLWRKAGRYFKLSTYEDRLTDFEPADASSLAEIRQRLPS